MRLELRSGFALVAPLLTGIVAPQGAGADELAARKLRPAFADSPATAAADINEQGQVAGYSTEDSATRAVVWDPSGRPHLLTSRGEASGAVAINNLGVAVGYDGGPVRWSANGVPTRLGVPRNGNFWHPCGGRAYDINDAGEVAGENHCPGGQNWAVLWDARGEPNTLRSLRRRGGSEAHALNNCGESPRHVAGVSGRLAVVWNPQGKVKALRPLSGDTSSSALGINCEGTIVGYSYSEGPEPHSRAVVWGENGRPVALALPRRCTDSFANGLNDAGFVVGSCVDPTIPGDVPLVWDPDGSVIELPLPNRGGVIEASAESINARGEIAGSALQRNGKQIGVVWR